MIEPSFAPKKKGNVSYEFGNVCGGCDNTIRSSIPSKERNITIRDLVCSVCGDVGNFYDAVIERTENSTFFSFKGPTYKLFKRIE